MSIPADRPVQVPGGTWVKTAQQYWKDFRERALRTAWQTFVAAVVAAQPVTDWSGAKAVLLSAAMAVGASVLSMVTSLFARNRGVKNSASTSTEV